jgi:alcohol dehydrogenase
LASSGSLDGADSHSRFTEAQIIAVPREQEAGSLTAEVCRRMGSARGRPLDVVADLVGGTAFNDLLRLLRSEGRYVTAGAIGGPVVQLDLRTMYLKHLELHGSSQGTRAAFRRLLRYIEHGQLKPLLAGRYRLS